MLPLCCANCVLLHSTPCALTCSWFKCAACTPPQVLGQFNLGFILARLDRDLFIIDQHASGERGAGGCRRAVGPEHAEMAVVGRLVVRVAPLLGRCLLFFIEVPALASPLFPSSDEKHNFERLQRTTTLNRQPLLAPQPLDLSPTEALTVR